MNEKELILTQVLKKKRVDLYSRDLSINTRQLREIERIKNKRRAGEPLQYILGRQEFMGLDIAVKDGVFIPRPETEILVEEAIKLATSSKLQASGSRLQAAGLRLQASGCRPQAPGYRILDIGTGSGCIAISLAKFIAKSFIIALDNSDIAINVAMKNAVDNGVGNRIVFIKEDIFNLSFIGSFLFNKRIDLIVSNPPYIPKDEIVKLQKEVRHEPKESLDGGKDGLRFFPRIMEVAENFLKKDGFLVMEMGYDQARQITDIASRKNKLGLVKIVKDYNDFERVIIFKKKN